MTQLFKGNIKVMLNYKKGTFTDIFVKHMTVRDGSLYVRVHTPRLTHSKIHAEKAMRDFDNISKVILPCSISGKMEQELLGYFVNGGVSIDRIVMDFGEVVKMCKMKLALEDTFLLKLRGFRE